MSLFEDAVRVVNAVRFDDPSLWNTENNASYTRLVNALGQIPGGTGGGKLRLPAKTIPSSTQALLADAVKAINYLTDAEDAGSQTKAEGMLAMQRLEDALGMDCHGNLYDPDIQLTFGVEPSEYEKLCDLAMEAFPEELVSQTKDIEELIQAAGAKLKKQQADIKVLVESMAGEWSAEDKNDEHSLAISNANPTKNGQYANYTLAVKLIGPRRSKFALVNLVNWLLTKPDLDND